MKSCLKQLREFLAHPRARNVWLCDSDLRVYVRKARRIHWKSSRKLVTTFDIASIAAVCPGRGIGTAFIRAAHEIHPYSATFIECVGNPLFAAWLERHGWDLEVDAGGTPSFWLVK